MNLKKSHLAICLISLTWLIWSAPPILLSTLPPSKQNTALAAAHTTDQNFMEAFVEAFAMVREAEAAGADSSQVKDLVDRLNLALNLTDQKEAAAISDQVKTDASLLREIASLRTSYNKILVFAMAPIAALTVTICVHYLLKLLHQNKVEQTMKMKIREKGKTQTCLKTRNVQQ